MYDKYASDGMSANCLLNEILEYAEDGMCVNCFLEKYSNLLTMECITAFEQNIIIY